MGRNAIDEGSSDLATFWYWIDERTRIYDKKEAKHPWPWTQDKVLQDYKFTNAFRQLDRGTVALNTALSRATTKMGILWSIWWYRLFNREEHAQQIYCDFTSLSKYIRQCKADGKKIFTGAHMTTGVAFEEKHDTYLEACEEAWSASGRVSGIANQTKSMEATFKELLQYYMVGRFVAYEIVCDMRWCGWEFHDRNTWANIGPGAKRGLRRLGLPVELDSMIQLLKQSPKNLAYAKNLELREIEHSLCEFDKYERTRTGQGRPRQRYRHVDKTKG